MPKQPFNLSEHLERRGRNARKLDAETKAWAVAAVKRAEQRKEADAMFAELVPTEYSVKLEALDAEGATPDGPSEPLETRAARAAGWLLGRNGNGK